MTADRASASTHILVVAVAQHASEFAGAGLSYPIARSTSAWAAATASSWRLAGMKWVPR